MTDSEDTAPGPHGDSEPTSINEPIRPPLDMATPEGLAAWRRMNLPRRGWRTIGYEPAEPGRWINRSCEWCAETIEAAAFTVTHPHGPRRLETCRLCRLTLEGRESTPGITIIATPDVRGRGLETELQRRKHRSRRSIDRVELSRMRNWFPIGELRYRYVDPRCITADITMWYDVSAMGWMWEVMFPDGTHREGGPVASLEVASEKFMQAKHDWQNA